MLKQSCLKKAYKYDSSKDPAIDMAVCVCVCVCVYVCVCVCVCVG